ncbi:MAG: phytanoyl-CoA dioxygenase family protein [Burkholderiales bacterium]|nr:phytanoyl-CoA dioxygenase family protein [Burkholderiales bacterium]
MLFEDGYFVLNSYWDNKTFAYICDCYNNILEDANQLADFVKQSKSTFSDYYKENKSLIVVPENNNTTICRFEYIIGHLPEFKKISDNLCLELKNLTGKQFRLFKDKCNIKSPGGGAFPPHQDAPAYINFTPTYHVTAAILLDAATEENGCLEMATNYLKTHTNKKTDIVTKVGTRPIFEYYIGGERNGTIIDEIQNQFSWEKQILDANNVVFFDSFIPHQSKINLSKSHRRIIYLTFNLEDEGDHYENYYEKKRHEYSNPIFHIATPYST